MNFVFNFIYFNLFFYYLSPNIANKIKPSIRPPIIYLTLSDGYVYIINTILVYFISCKSFLSIFSYFSILL